MIASIDIVRYFMIELLSLDNRKVFWFIVNQCYKSYIYGLPEILFLFINTRLRKTQQR